MSLNDKEGTGGAGAALAQQAPRLLAGGYAAWAPHMDVFLQRHGAEGVHRKAITAKQWQEREASVDAWVAEAEGQALELAMGAAALAGSASATAAAQVKEERGGSVGGAGGRADDGAASHSGAKPAPLTEEVRVARKLVTALVERSRRVFGIIYAALPEELRTQAAHIPVGFAYGLWHWLETKFQSTEEDSVGELLAQWTQLRQSDDESFDAYRARVNKLATLLEHAKEKQSARMFAHVLLDKLQPRYRPAVLALKASGQLKEADKVAWDTVAMFINAHEREEQRLRAGDDATGSAMAVRTEQAQAAMARAPAPSEQPRREAGGHDGDRGQRGSHPRTLADVQCFKCLQFGHLARHCPKSGGRGHGGKGGNASPRGGKPRSEQVSVLTSANAFAPLAIGGQDSVPNAVAYTVTTVGQASQVATYAAVVKGLATPGVAPKIPGEPAAAGAVTAPVPVVSTGSSAVPVSKAEAAVSGQVAAVTKAPDPPAPVAKANAAAQAPRAFGVDSMASLSVSGCKAVFRQLRACDSVVVSMADGSVVTTSQRGSVELHLSVAPGQTVTLVVDDVYYHPCFAANLLSLERLTAKGWQFHSSKEQTHLVTPCGHKVHLDTRHRVSMLHCSTGAAAEQGRVYSLGELVVDSAADLVRLHERLGHVGFDRMVRLMRANKTDGLGKLITTDAVLQEARRRVLQCPACTQGKGTRTAFGKRGLDRGSRPGESLHMDSYQVRVERDGREVVEYGLTISDPHTAFRWFARLTSKDAAAQAVIDSIRMAQTQLGCKVKRLHTDGGTEFINQSLKNFCAKEGIGLHWPAARTPQLNSIAERQVRSSKDAARTLLLHAGLPGRFWAHAVYHATYVWNRTHVAAATGVTPYEAMLNRKPSMQHLGVFGCDAYYHLPKEQRLKFGEPKMVPCIYLGHRVQRECAVVLDLRTGQEVVTRDVEFREHRFTHATALVAGGERMQDVLASGYSQDDTPAAAGSVPRIDFNGPPASPSSDEYDVERILGKRQRHGRTEYHVQWAGYSVDEATWEPMENVELGASEALDDFEAGLLQRSGDSPEAAAEAAPQEPEVPEPAMPAGNAAADLQSPAASAVAPRRSPRVLDSSRSLDAAAHSHRVHMAVSAIQDSQGASDPSFADAELVCAVTAGLSLLEEQTPQTYAAAMASPDVDRWRAAMDAEMEACERMQVWELVPRDSVPRGVGQTVLPPKWVFKVKTDETGAVTSFKARITPKGFLQREGVNFSETFAPTGMYKTMRLGLSLTAAFDHELDQMDVPTAFLNADVDEEVYMELPEGYRQGREHLVCKLRKALYGLKQAPRNWYLLISKYVVEQLGFKATVSDPCLFFRRSRTGRLMMLFLFVDDFQVSYHREDAAEWGALKAMLVERFRTKDLGASTWILGMRIQRDRRTRTITLDQELYITKALERYGMQQCKPVATPEVSGSQASADPESGASSSGNEPADKLLFQEMVGTLMYGGISCRLDITHAVHRLASAMQAPTQRDAMAAKRVLRYLAGTKAIGLVFGSRVGAATAVESRGWSGAQVDVCAFADADWANDKVDRKSVTGWVAKLNGDPVSWASKKQRTVAQSTCEAELYAEAAAIQEVLWLRGLLRELGLHVRSGSVVHGDNQSTIAVSKNGVKGERTKHVDVKYRFITETIAAGTVQLKWVPTTEQHADIFTKALGAPAFECFRKLLMSC